MPRPSTTPGFFPRTPLHHKRMATGLLATFFVWLSVLAPALHQHNRTSGATVTARTASVSAKSRRAAALSEDTALISADDFCSLCDYLTTATFAPPPPAPACIVVDTCAVRGPPAVFSLSAPLLRRALPRFSPRGPPVLA